MVKKQIIALIKGRRAHVGVVGLGYVGLPLLAEFARNGYQATGFEVDKNKAAQINAGDSYIQDISREDVSALVESGKLTLEDVKEAEQALRKLARKDKPK